MSILAAIALAIAIAFGGSAPAPEAPVQPAPVQQVQEHDPILEMDAQATLDDVKGLKKTITDKDGTYVATYVDSDESSDSKYAEFTLESIDFPGTFHHFTYMKLSDA